MERSITRTLTLRALAAGELLRTRALTFLVAVHAPDDVATVILFAVADV